MPMRWAIITGMYNVADLATEFCRYHLGLGADRIFVADYGLVAWRLTTAGTSPARMIQGISPAS